MPTSLIAGLAYVGGALGASGATAVVVGGAVVGAAAGGVYAAVSGGNVLKGVLVGAGVGTLVGGGLAMMGGVGTAATPTVEGLDAFYTAAPLATNATTSALPSVIAPTTGTGLLSSEYVKGSMIMSGMDFAKGAAQAYGAADAAEENRKAEIEAERERRAATAAPNANTHAELSFTKDENQAMSYRNFFEPLETKTLKQKGMLENATTKPSLA